MTGHSLGEMAPQRVDQLTEKIIATDEVLGFGICQ